MDYALLADELIRYIIRLRFTEVNRCIDDNIRGEPFILAHVYHAHSALPGELAAAMQTSTAYVAKVLRGLEEKGLICRTLDTHDRRRILVTLTDKGIRQAEMNEQFVKAKTQQMLENLGAEDALALIRILKKISGALAEAHSS